MFSTNGWHVLKKKSIHMYRFTESLSFSKFFSSNLYPLLIFSVFTLIYMCFICLPFLLFFSLACKQKMEQGRLLPFEARFLISDVQFFEIRQNLLQPKNGSIFKSAGYCYKDCICSSYPAK